MQENDELKMFETMRLHPWIPDHKVKIAGFLGAMKGQADITGEDASYLAMKEQYDKKLKAYEKEQKEVTKEPEKPNPKKAEKKSSKKSSPKK